MIRICFVCLGNICRSPSAEGLMLNLLKQEGLLQALEVDSAGTAAHHVGESADPRSIAAAAARGISLTGHARQFHVSDFENFDYIVAMDRSNRENILKLKPDAKVYLFRDFDPQSKKCSDVPDPYYGGENGFEDVLNIVERAAKGFLSHLTSQHKALF